MKIIIGLMASLLMTQYTLCMNTQQLLYKNAVQTIIAHSPFLQKTYADPCILGQLAVDHYEKPVFKEQKETDDSDEPFDHLVELNSLEKDAIISLASVINDKHLLNNLSFQQIHHLHCYAKFLQVELDIELSLLQKMLKKNPSAFEKDQWLYDDYTSFVQCCDESFLKKFPGFLLNKKNEKSKQEIENYDNESKEDIKEIKQERNENEESIITRIIQTRSLFIKDQEKFIYPISNLFKNNKDLFVKYVLQNIYNKYSLIVVESDLESVFSLENYCTYFNLKADSMRKLFLFNNNIKDKIHLSLVCSHFPNVKYIDLSNNVIKKLIVDTDYFKINNNLKHLILKNNKIEGTLDLSKLLIQFPNMQTIDISGNNIKTIIFPATYYNPSLTIYVSSKSNIMHSHNCYITQEKCSPLNFYYKSIESQSSTTQDQLSASSVDQRSINAW